MRECPDCGNELNGREYNDGGDSQTSEPYWYWKCNRCGWYDPDDLVYDDEDESDFYE